MKGITEVALRRRPVKRDALAGELLKGSAIPDDGFFKPLGTVLLPAKDLKGGTEVVLRRGPTEWHTLAGTLLESRAIGVDGLFQVLGAALPFA